MAILGWGGGDGYAFPHGHSSATCTHRDTISERFSSRDHGSANRGAVPNVAFRFADAGVRTDLHTDLHADTGADGDAHAHADHRSVTDAQPIASGSFAAGTGGSSLWQYVQEPDFF